MSESQISHYQISQHVFFSISSSSSLIYIVNLVGKVRVSPLRPRCVLANGVATVFSAPARIMMKKEYLVASDRQNDIDNH